ncbi:MAG: hypothetical protein JWP01_2945 [Myxococcales bacterium]|nr:hypothetical protein [Myxococcales bacterium]
MRRAVILLALVVGLSVPLGACKGDRKKCEEACRNYASLVYWKKVDAEIAALPEAERDAHRKKRLAAFASQLENGVDLCINQCSSANNDEQMNCMIVAKTAIDAEKCVEDD